MSLLSRGCPAPVFGSFSLPRTAGWLYGLPMINSTWLSPKCLFATWVWVMQCLKFSHRVHSDKAVDSKTLSHIFLIPALLALLPLSPQFISKISKESVFAFYTGKGENELKKKKMIPSSHMEDSCLQRQCSDPRHCITGRLCTGVWHLAQAQEHRNGFRWMQEPPRCWDPYIPSVFPNVQYQSTKNAYSLILITK